MLYKYLSLDKPGSEKSDELLARFSRMLAAGEIYLSSPENFNDPFDCNPTYIVPDRTSAAFLNSYGRAGMRIGESLSEIALSYQERIKMSDAQWAEEVKRTGNKYVRNVGVFCATPNRDHPLMWAHYANSHTGICVGLYRTGALIDMQKVIYEGSVRPTYDYISGTKREFFEVFYRKAECWAYEEEERLISFDITHTDSRNLDIEAVRADNEARARFMERNAGPGTFALGDEAVGEVILGCAISPAHREAIVRLIRDSGKNITVFECRMHTHEYKMDIVEVAI